MKPFNKNKGIETDNDFNDYVSEMLDEFLYSFTLESGLIREIEEDDEDIDESWTYLYTSRAIRLKDNYERRLFQVAEAHGFDLSLSVTAYKEL